MVLHRLDLVQTATSPAGAPAVRGRDAELAALGAGLGRVRSGVGARVILEGCPGMGKTRLLAEGAKIARRMSFGVGRGAAEPGETVVELAPLLSALFDGAEPLFEREALQALHALPGQRYWLLQDIQSLLERAALEQPLLVCLDDVQWADSGTAAAVRALPARLAAVPIGWGFALRPGPGSPPPRSA